MYGILQMDWTHIDNNEKLSSWWMGVCGNVLWPEDVESVEQTKTILNNEGDKPSLWELMEGRLWCSRIASKGLMGSSCLDGKNVTQERHEANSSKQMNAGTGEGMYGNNMADRKTKSYKGAVTLGNTADEGTKTGRYEQKWRFRGVSSLRPIVETAKADKSKSVCRPLFQQKKEVERDTVEMVSQTAEPEVHEPTEQSEVQPNLTEENEHPTQNEELEGDGIELTLSEEEAVNAAGDVDFEQEDTLLYTEDDLLEDMAFCAAVANVDSMTEADRIIIHSEFEQNLKKCRVSEQPAQHGGPSKTTSKNNTPIRGVRFKKALALKAMSPRKTPKNKITKESTTREKDKSPMKF